MRRGRVARAIAGTRFLFHVAADYRLWARKPGEILVNYREGTRLLMQAALAAGVERVVYTSSVATIACAADGGQGDETMRPSESCAIGAYKQARLPPSGSSKRRRNDDRSRAFAGHHHRASDGADWAARPETDAGSSSKRHLAAFRVLSIPGSISCMSTMSQAAILPRCGLASPAIIIFSAVKM